MTVVECDIPESSVMDRKAVEAAYFRDSYRAPLRHPNANVTELFVSIFAHYPMWIKAVLIIRNWFAGLVGLEVPTVAEILNFPHRKTYAVGDKIGVWPIMALTDTELVAGRNNKHLDFRLSVLKEMNSEGPSVVVSTMCTVHNVFGKIYLFFVVPFHKWGVKRIISNAVAAGRL